MLRVSTLLYPPRTLEPPALRGVHSQAVALPALVAHTHDAPLAAATSNMPAELGFLAKTVFPLETGVL